MTTQYKIYGTLQELGEPPHPAAKYPYRSFKLGTWYGTAGQMIKMRARGPVIQALDDLEIGDHIEVTFSLLGNDYLRADGETGNFTVIEAMDIKLVDNNH